MNSPFKLGLGVRRRAMRVAKACILVGVAFAAAGMARADSHEASDARARANQARESEVALSDDIAAQSEQIDEVEAEINTLRAEVATLEGQLQRSRSRLQSLERELAEKVRTLTRARQQVGVAQRHLSRRVVEIYTSGEPDAVAIVLGAESLESMIELLDARTRTLEADSRIVSQIQALRVRVRRERARTAAMRQQQAIETTRLEHHTSERRGVMTSLVARGDSLTTLRSARQQSLDAVRVQRREWEAQADALEAESARISSVAAAAPAFTPSRTDSAAASTAGFVWPVQGALVSPYGQRWGRLHAGIDIAAPAGTPIVASAAGQVAYAGYMGGYGLIVVIQHADGITTAYAHNSSNAVSVGQSVSQGQPIATVGCTGHCYGDHVHFEVRVGGSPVDPMDYL